MRFSGCLVVYGSSTIYDVKTIWVGYRSLGSVAFFFFSEGFVVTWIAPKIRVLAPFAFIFLMMTPFCTLGEEEGRFVPFQKGHMGETRGGFSSFFALE